MTSHTLRGDGLIRVHGALAALQEDPRRLERARVRFSASPPSYTSHQSHNSTLSQSPNPPSEEQRRREERKWRIINERRASCPYEQFEAQTSAEQAWLHEAEENGIRLQPVHVNFYKLAYETVRKRWVEQGIWGANWSDMADGVWKHERPLESELEVDKDTEAEAYILPSLFSGLPREPKLPRPQSDEDNRQIAEQRTKQERQRQASRPFYQFVYQVSIERERIQEELRVGAAGLPVPADINTIAYERVRGFWIKQKIWNNNWGTLPGMSWKHEDPFPVDETPSESGSQAAEDAPIITGAPPRRIFARPASTEPSHQGSSVTKASSQVPPANVDSPGLENRPSPSNFDFSLDMTEQPAQATSTSSRKDRQIRALDGTLGSVHQSKVVKTSSRKPSGPRRQPRALNGAAPSSPRPEVVKPSTQPAGILPRRSKRLETGLASSLDGTGVAGRRNNTSRTRPQRSGAASLQAAGSAKPHGVSKRQRSQATRQGQRNT